MPMSAVSSAAERRVRPVPRRRLLPQHRVNGGTGANHASRLRPHRRPGRFRGHLIARGGGIRGDGGPRQSDRRRLQGPQRHDFNDKGQRRRL